MQLSAEAEAEAVEGCSKVQFWMARREGVLHVALSLTARKAEILMPR